MRIWTNYCLSQGILELDTIILSEYIFHLLGRHHQLLFKYNLERINVIELSKWQTLQNKVKISATIL